MFVYVIVNDVNWKIYVGKTVRKSLRGYLRGKVEKAKYGVKSHLYSAIRKHGREHFHIYPLVTDCQTNEELCHWEQVLIKALASQNPAVGYNLSAGGEAGYYGCKHSLETRQKLSVSGRKLRLSKEARQRISDSRKGQPHPHKGHPHSEETRRKLSEVRKGQSPWNKGIRQHRNRESVCLT